MRFDKFVASKLNISRNQASALIEAEKILLNGEICAKNSFEISSGDIDVIDEIYVGRGALKLKSFLKSIKKATFGAKIFDEINNAECLDIGSSTGGFVQILLQNGAKSVVALDVGTSQLAEILKNDERVEVYENTDIRSFESKIKFDFVTCDVSFISLNLIIERILKLSKKYVIILFKPQFEVGKEAKRDKKGVVKDEKKIALAKALFEQNIYSYGAEILLCELCQIAGKNGNNEYFYLIQKEKDV